MQYWRVFLDSWSVLADNMNPILMLSENKQHIGKSIWYSENGVSCSVRIPCILGCCMRPIWLALHSGPHGLTGTKLQRRSALLHEGTSVLFRGLGMDTSGSGDRPAGEEGGTFRQCAFIPEEGNGKGARSQWDAIEEGRGDHLGT